MVLSAFLSQNFVKRAQKTVKIANIRHDNFTLKVHFGKIGASSSLNFFEYGGQILKATNCMLLPHTPLYSCLYKKKNVQRKPSMPRCSHPLGVTWGLNNQILQRPVLEIIAIKVYVVILLHNIFEY